MYRFREPEYSTVKPVSVGRTSVKGGVEKITEAMEHHAQVGIEINVTDPRSTFGSGASQWK